MGKTGVPVRSRSQLMPTRAYGTDGITTSLEFVWHPK